MTYLFRNPTPYNKINGFTMNFDWLNGFGMMTSTNTTYYLADNNANTVYVLNHDWNLIDSFYCPYPANILVVQNFLYISSDSLNLFKTDSNLNILATYSTEEDFRIRGIYFNSTNQLIYLAVSFSYHIFRFDLNLNYYDNFSTGEYIPYSINGFENKLYVGENDFGLILVMINNIIVNTFNGCFGNSGAIPMISLDQNGFMANVCEGSQSVYLYNVNGTYANFDLSTEQYPVYVGMDSKGRVFVISKSEITFY